jgi:hypothetical protein
MSAIYTFRQTSLGPEDFAWLQSCSQDNVLLSKVARAACRHFGWVRSNGELPIAACSVMLRRLERLGIVRLSRPARRRVGGAYHWERERWRIIKELGPVAGSVEYQPEGPLTVRPILAQERDGFRLHLERYHYLGFQRSVGESMGYAALVGNELVALLDWGAAALHCGPRDRYIGWSRSARESRLHLVVANRRFLVLPWIKLHCLASRVLGANLRRISHDWSEAYGHPVLLAETTVDSARFKGTCYRASNWTYVGQTRGFTRLRDGFAQNHRPKSIFIYELARHGVARLRDGIGDIS